jgi:hypothetical protein
MQTSHLIQRAALMACVYDSPARRLGSILFSRMELRSLPLRMTLAISILRRIEGRRGYRFVVIVLKIFTFPPFWLFSLTTKI